jgi:hypothetical protein
MNIGTGGGSVATNTAFGASALNSNTTGGGNAALSRLALASNTTGNDNTSAGNSSMQSNTTGTANTAFGSQALTANTTASSNTAVGYQSLYDNTTGAANVAIGFASLANNTTAEKNVAVGTESLETNTTGQYNVALGTQALRLNTTASYNTAVGYQAGYTNATGISNTYIGYGSGNLATGTGNSFLGQGSGDQITSGAANTIIGRYNGNNDGLDIRTASNNIVLSDGDGNVRMHYRGSDASWKSLAIYNNTTGSAANMTVLSSGTIARSTSSLKYKRDVQDATHGLAEVLQLRPVTYKGKNENDGETVFGGLIAEEVHTAGLTEFVQYAEDGSPDALAYGNMVSLMVKAMQEQQALITALTTRITALEAKVGA